MVKTTVSKSDAIRTLVAKQPAASPTTIHAALIKKGIKASLALVNKIKYGRKSRRSKGVSKAEAIRRTWGKLGANARPRDVIDALGKRGINVSSAQVSTLRTNSRSKSTPISLDHLLAAKELASRLGSIDSARQALDSLAKLLAS